MKAIFSANTELLGAVMHYCRDRNGHASPCSLFGVAGSGKTTILQMAFDELLGERTRAELIFIAEPKIGMTTTSFLRELCLQIRALYRFRDVVGHETDSLIETLQAFLARIPLARPLILLTDSVDRVQGSLFEFLQWFPRGLTGSVRWVASIDGPQSPYFDCLQRRDIPLFELPHLSVVEIHDRISRAVGATDRELSPPTPHFANPLYLETWAAESERSGGEPPIESSADEAHIDAEQALRNLFASLLERWEHRFGSPLVRETLLFLSASRTGLREDELRQLVEQRGQVAWSSDLWHRLSPHLYFAQGHWRPNRHLFRVVQYRYADSEEVQFTPAIHQSLAARLENEDGSVDNLAEWSWHIRQADSAERLSLAILDPARLTRLWKESPLDALELFRLAITSDPDLKVKLVSMVPAELRGELLARLHFAMEHLDEALTALRKEEFLLRTGRELSRLLPNLSFQASVLESQGATAEAAAVLQELERHCRETGNLPVLLHTLRRRGLLALERGELPAAHEHFAMLERLAGDVQDSPTTMLAHIEQARLAVVRDDDTAVHLAKHLEIEARAVGNIVALETSLEIQVSALLKERELERAGLLLQEQRRISMVTGNASKLAAALGQLALTAQHLGNAAQSLEYLEHKEIVCRETSDIPAVVRCLVTQAALLAGKLDRSADAFERAAQAVEVAALADDEELLEKARALALQIRDTLPATVENWSAS